MRGKRLTVDEVKALPLGTKVVVVRGKGWEIYQGENLEMTDLEHGAHCTIDNDRYTDSIESCEELQTEYYEYVEGSTANEEDI